MHAYMKSAMPYLRVQATPLRHACREVFTSFPLGTPEQWRAAVVALWRGAQ
jgi:hypothetical protein